VDQAAIEGVMGQTLILLPSLDKGPEVVRRTASIVTAMLI